MARRRVLTALCLTAGFALCLACERLSGWFESPEEEGLPPDWVVKVGQSLITERALALEMSLVAGELLPEPGSPDHAAVREVVLEDLIHRRLLVAEARRRRVVLDPDTLAQRMADIYGGSGTEALQNAADRLGVTVEGLEERTQEALLVEKLFTEDVYPRLLIREDELSAAYDGAAESLTQPEMVRVLQVVTSAEEEAQEAYRRLRAGEDFAAVARELSIGTEADQGGDMGWVSAEALPPPLDEVVFTLPRRTINRPVKSDYGYHIFYIAGHRERGRPGLEEALPRLKRTLFEAKKQQAEAELLEHLMTRTPIIRRSAGERKGRQP